MLRGDCREMICGRKQRRRRLAGAKRHFREGFSASLRHYCVRLTVMRESGVRHVLIYCADYHRSHSIAMSADQRPDDVRLSDIEDRFVCKPCGQSGADVRPNFSGRVLTFRREDCLAYRDETQRIK